MVNARIRVPFENAIQDVRNAWKALRFLHPGIAVELHGDEKRYHPIRDESMLEAWCDATFRVETEALSADDLFKRHVRMAGPQATCHWIPATNQIALMASHWRWDARGASWVLNDLLKELGGPSSPPDFTGAEVKNLPFSFEEALRIPDTWDPTWEQRGRDLQALESQGGPGIALRPSYPDVLPGDTIRTEVVLSRGETTALREGARAYGLTVTPVLNASAIVETALVNAESSATCFKSFGLFDLRKYCASPSNGPRDASALRIHFLPINVDAHASWKELTPLLSAFYRQSWDSKYNDAIFSRVSYIEANHKMGKMAPPDAAQLSEPMINSLGVIEDYIQHQYGAVEVEDVSYSNLALGKQIAIQVFTWRGQMHLSASFNEAFYTSDFVEDFLQAIKYNTFTNLGISSEERPPRRDRDEVL
ncbi:hypothetical protein N7507_006667 [Penicillium longicatenatum]|nr:hypothetical protein N7507_006667 [Penicillium longicatenatum]